MNGKRTYIWLLIFHLFSGVILTGQDCNSPLFTLSDNITSTSIKLNWTDFNDQVLGWELEWGLAGFDPTGESSTLLLESPGYVIDDLLPGTSYDVYIRAICSEDLSSEWNGPFKATTAIDNDLGCNIDLAIRDNNCPRLESFFIEVDGYDDLLLGQDIFIQNVELIIDHDWPADLEMFLVSPSGNRIMLSQNRGIGLDHYGIPSDSTCSEVLSFSDFACVPIGEVGTDQLVGSFQPEERLSNLYQMGPVNGLWRLNMCDRALEDKGILKYARINFAPVICNVPIDIVAREISDRSAVIEWTPPSNCRTAIINVVFAGEAPGTNIEIFTSCQGGSFLVSDLLPETAYDIYIRSDCNSSKSAFSCPASFITACSEVTLAEGFDSRELCIESCNSDCTLSGAWFNSRDDGQDWLVHNGPTATLNTGPDTDISGVGNYIYIENTTDLCGIRNQAILETTCIQFQDNPGICDMSFYFHMNGEDIDSLLLLISTDDQETWDTLFHKYGSNELGWQRVFIDLEGYGGEYGSVRFIGISGINDRADMALDQIEFYGTDQVLELPSFYFDMDGDGFGGQDSLISMCILNPPDRFYKEALDCDDTNPNINPNGTEIQCNLIDENCNGLEDDVASINPILYEIEDLVNESCPGAQDASISLSISGGNPPYEVLWSDGSIGNNITSLSEDVYRATITDAGTCTIVTEFIDIDLISMPQIFIVDQGNSQCDANTGFIDIEVTGGEGPYQYFWNNGATSQDLNSIPEGNYTVTITDANGCDGASQNIFIDSSPRFTAGIQFQKDLLCHGDSNGILSIGIFNAIPPVTYQWSNGDTTDTSNALAAGKYTITINDARGCEEIIEGEIIAPEKLEAEVINIEQVTCYDGSNGSIQVITSGGFPPYNFKWNSEPSLSFSESRQEDINNLPTGTYQLQVSDGNGCIDTTKTIRLLNPEDIKISIDSTAAVRCILSSDGYVSVDVGGGAGSYNYFWGASDIDQSFLNNIPGGTYSLTVIDKFGCKKTVNDIIVEVGDNPIDVVSMVLMENLCYYDSVGMIMAEVQEASLPLDFNWSSGRQIIVQTNKDTVSGLAGGNYNVTVTDNEGCVGTSPLIQISRPDEIILTDIEIERNNCNGDAEGSIRLEVLGGVAPYEYTWSHGGDGPLVEQLIDGAYFVTIEDNNSCIYEFGPFNVTTWNPISVIANIEYADGGMDNGSIDLIIEGGTPPYSVDWENLEDELTTHVNLGLGSYCVTITDDLGCQVEDCFSVDRSNNTIDLNNQVKIFPNPAKSLINVESLFILDQIRIYNTKGILVQSLQPGAQNVTIPLENLPEGIYILLAYTSEGILSEKIVISN